MKTKIINGIVLNIYHWKEESARIKILTEKDDICFILVKGFYKLENKNKNNIFVGLITSFEVIEKYSINKQYYLKRANMEYFVDLSDKKNQKGMQRILPLLQKIEKSNEKFYCEYKEFLIKWNIEAIEWFETYCSNQILVSNGEKRQLNYCVVCNKNKNLYSFNFDEGGIFCFNHSIDNKYTIYKLKIIKSFYYLGISFEEYYKKTDYFTNKTIFNILNGT